MTARRSTLQFSLHIWLALCLFIALVITFVFYVHLEKEVDRANDLRHQSLLLANELRQSSDDLTRMARSYVATGIPIYKQYYQDIIDIRDGKLPRPQSYPNIHWELLLSNEHPKQQTNQPAIALLDLMRTAKFSAQEFQLLEAAKIESDNLTPTERKAMSLIENAEPDQLENLRVLAVSQLFGNDYDSAKAAVMQPINQFFNSMNKRTLEAVTQAEYKAAIMRYTLIGFGLCLVFVLWRMSKVLQQILGGTVNEVYNQITRIGKGDFTSTIQIKDTDKNSVLGWLGETQRNLQRIRQERLHVEEAKLKSDARYRKLFDSAGFGIVIFLNDPNSTLIDGNPFFCDMFGYTLNELRELRPADVVADEQIAQIAPAIDEIQSTDLAREWQLKRKDGSVFTADVISTAMPDGTMMSMVRDISARKQAEEELRSSEENLAITLQSIGDAVIATDAHGFITRMNPTAERMTGWNRADSIGLQLNKVFHIINADTRHPSRNPVELVMEHGQVVGLANHTALIARDGTEYQIADSAAPIRDGNGQIVGVVLVFSDVSERYLAIEALRRADERFRTTFKLIPNPLTLQTKDGLLLDCSDAFCEASGYSREEIIGQDTQNLGLWAYPEERNAMRELLKKNGRVDDFEFQMRRRNGEIRIVEFSARFLDTESEPILLAVAHDITQRKQAEEAVRQNERFIATLAHNIPSMVSHWTHDLRCNFANKEYLNWFGKTAEEVYLSTPQQIIGKEAFKHDELYMCAALEGKTQSFERVIARPGGGNIYLWTQYIPDISNGEIKGMFVVAQDISERKQAELALQESARHTQAILDNMFDGVITINTRGTIQSFNKAASTIFGYSQDEVLGSNVTMLMPPHFKNQHESYLRHHDESLDSEVLNTLREVEGKRKNGDTFPMSLSISKILRAGTVTFVGLVRDISQQRHDEEEIYRLAFYDPLTNLPNRRLLFDRLQQAILTSCRTDQHGALMFLDLDHFKQLNDSLGHDVGDILLQQVAVRLQACLREGDSVARMGGDEFVMLIEALSIYPNEAATQAEVIAHKILAALAAPYNLREHTYIITPSIGIVVFLHQQDNLDELLKKADVAMYQAKTAGRNNARFFDPTMQAAVSVRITLEKNMRIALEREEFLLHYQLQVDSQSRPTGVEALVRWNHSQHGMISPAAFIPLAEETGMILPLGQWVLETACVQLVKWAKRPETASWTMAVNVSASQFIQPNFVANVTTALSKTGANPHLLKLELTESMLVKDVEDVIVKMVEIKALGVTFSLDDFGTGYSSLSYLKRLPLDQLKIDQSFVRDLLTDPNDAAIAHTIITLGHSLSLKVIAEGVETREQRDALAQMGCDTYQGYYFARPVAAADLAKAILQIPT